MGKICLLANLLAQAVRPFSGKSLAKGRLLSLLYD